MNVHSHKSGDRGLSIVVFRFLVFLVFLFFPADITLHATANHRKSSQLIGFFIISATGHSRYPCYMLAVTQHPAGIRYLRSEWAVNRSVDSQSILVEPSARRMNINFMLGCQRDSESKYLGRLVEVDDKQMCPTRLPRRQSGEFLRRGLRKEDAP